MDDQNQILKIDELPEEERGKFMETFQKVTGIESAEAFGDILSKSQKAQELEQSFNQLKAEKEALSSTVGKYQLENPIGRKVVDMFVEGADLNSVQEFLRYQTVDPNKMSVKELLIEKMVGEGVARDLATMFTERELAKAKDADGTEDEDLMLKLQIDADKTRKMLSEKKVAWETPEILAKKQAAEIEMQNMMSTYSQASPVIANKFQKIELPFKFGETETMVSMEIPPEVLQVVRRGVEDFGLANKLAINDPRLMEHAKRIIYYHYGDKLLENALAQSYQQVAAKFSNSTNPQPGNPKPPVNTGGDKVSKIEKFAEDNLKSGRF